MTFQEGHMEDAQSSLSAQTTTCGLPVCWLLSPKHDSDNKYQEILDCLEGTSNERISLWKLRELALSSGGLLCPQVRKRAWPILLGCQQQILVASLKPQPPAQVTPSTEDLQDLQRDIERTLWNVEEHLMSSNLLQQQQEEATKRAMQLPTNLAKKRVSFALPLLEVSETSEDDTDTDVVGNDQLSPSSLASNESSESIDSPQAALPAEKNACNAEDKDDPPSEPASAGCMIKPALKSTPLDSNISNEQEDTFHEDDISTVETQGTYSSFTISSRLAHWREASRQEQKVLFNVVTSVLRMTSSSSTDAYFEDDTYHYVKGLHDVAAILMINLESPSLTTCVFQQLAKVHFRDAMRPSRSTFDKLMEAAFPSLLRQVDNVLYEHLSSSSIKFPDMLCHVRPWLKCWFTQDVSDLRVASRVMDVMLVSHPLMSVYLAVAVWIVQRESLLLQEDSSSEDLRSLAAETLTVEEIENVINKALEITKQVQPAQLIHQARLAVGNVHVNAIALFQSDLPSWMTRNECLTECALWQRTTELRQNEKGDQLADLLQRDVTISASTVAKEYPLAWTALGGARSLSVKMRRRSVFLLLGAACLVMLTGMILPGRTSLVTLRRTRPQVSIVKKASPDPPPLAGSIKECVTFVLYPWLEVLAPGIATHGFARHEGTLRGRNVVQELSQEVNRRAHATQNHIKSLKNQSELTADTVIHKLAQVWFLVMQRSNDSTKILVDILASTWRHVGGRSLHHFANCVSALEKGGAVVANGARLFIGASLEESGNCWRFLKNDVIVVLKEAATQAVDGLTIILMEQSWALKAEKHFTHQEQTSFQKPLWLSDLRGKNFEPLWWKNLANDDFKALW